MVRPWLSLVLASAMLVPLLGTAPVAWAGEPPAHVARDPIIIANNEDFTPANGVTGGGGTQDNPYVIEGWQINASLSNGSAAGITISHTDASFTIRNVVVREGGDLYGGIWLSNVKNGRIERTALIGNYEGITLNSTTNITICGNEIRGNMFSGIYGISSQQTHIQGNEVGNSTYGVYLCCCADYVLSGNNVSARYTAVLVNRSEGIVLEGNNISDSEYGIYFDYVSDATATGNSIARNGCGIYMSPACEDIVIENNVFADNEISIHGTAEEGDGAALEIVPAVAAGTAIVVAFFALIMWRRRAPRQ